MVMNAIFYVLVTGRQWRNLPNDYPSNHAPAHRLLDRLDHNGEAQREQTLQRRIQDAFYRAGADHDANAQCDHHQPSKYVR
jgi:transposase